MADPDRVIWERMLSHLRVNHASLCRQWFAELVPLGVSDGQFNVRAPEQVKRNYLHRQCIDPFNDAAFTVTGRLIPVRFLGPDEDYTPPSTPGLSTSAAHNTSALNGNGTVTPARPARPSARAETDRQAVREVKPPPARAREVEPPGSNGDPAHSQISHAASRAMNGSAIDPGVGTGLAPRSPHEHNVIEHRLVRSRRDDSLVINPDYCFENFVVGPENRLAHAASVAAGKDPGHAYNPLFIHGRVGLGKTHLLQAICLRVLESNPHAVLYYISCESFVTQFIDAVQAGEMGDFRHRFRDVDVLVIDDIHFLTKRDRTQEEFFHTFNSLYQAEKQIILSSDAPPEEIPDLEDRLVSRFKWGLVTKVDPPCFETRVAILKTKARLRDLDFSDDVACYIAARIDSNIRELEGAITKVQIYAQVENRAIDMDLVKTAMGDDSRVVTSEPSIQSIIDAVTQFYRIRVTDLQSKRRPRSVVLPRQVCMYLARRHTRHSLEEIGGYFGGRDHTTVMHAIKTVEAKVASDEAFSAVIKGFEDRLRPAHRAGAAS